MFVWIVFGIVLCFGAWLYRRALEWDVAVHSLPDALVFVDKRERIIRANRAFSSRKNLRGKPLASIDSRIAQSGNDACLEVLRDCLRTNAAVTRCVNKERSDRVHYHITATPVKRGAVVVIAERKAVDGRDFVANASHELRTPITIIRGFAEMLQDLPEVSSEMLEDVVEKIIRNCARMNALVKNLLTLADLDHQMLKDLQTCDLVSLIDSCNYTLITMHPSATIELLYNTSPIEVQANPELIELCFMNILENAVKYSENQAYIAVTVEALEHEVRVVISDQGRGIPEEDVPHIFDRFYTVDKAHTRKLGGAGLGLSIVQKICALHNIDIDVESQEGKGSSFIFRFHAPASKPKAEPSISR